MKKIYLNAQTQVVELEIAAAIMQGTSVSKEGEKVTPGSEEYEDVAG